MRHGWEHVGRICLMGDGRVQRDCYRCGACGAWCVVVPDASCVNNLGRRPARVRRDLVYWRWDRTPLPDDCNDEIARQVMSG